MLYNSKGQLEMAYHDGVGIKTMNKQAKAMSKELKAYEKTFAQYASLDIDNEKMHEANDEYIRKKLGIVDKYIDYVPEGDAAEIMGDELTAIAGNKSAAKLRPSFSAKIASKFQPFFEKQAEKHPKLQGLSDRVTKAANDGRMPLTADSAAMMRIAYDKKFYNDCRRPGADIEALTELHKKAVNNLTEMAAIDGVSCESLSNSFSKKIREQMMYDETFTDLYAGMATGGIRIDVQREPVLNSKGKAITVSGKPLYKTSYNFVSPPDENGKHQKLDPWNFEVREKASVDDVMANYTDIIGRYMMKCENEADLKKVLDSDSFKYLSESTKRMAAADCPNEAAKFEYEFGRTNRMACRSWAVAFCPSSKLVNLKVPDPWDEVTNDKPSDTYSFNEYESIDDEKIISDIVEKPEQDFDKDAYIKRLEEELAAIKSQFSGKQAEDEVSVEDNETEQPENTDIVINKSENEKSSNKDDFYQKFNSFMNNVANTYTAMSAIKDVLNYKKNEVKTPENDNNIIEVDSNSIKIEDSKPVEEIPEKNYVVNKTALLDMLHKTNNVQKTYLSADSKTLKEIEEKSIVIKEPEQGSKIEDAELEQSDVEDSKEPEQVEIEDSVEPKQETVENTKADEKEEYSLFSVEQCGEIRHYRDDNTKDIDSLMKRYADCDGFLPDYTENCTHISVSEFAELEQSEKNGPVFSAEIDVDNNELTVWSGNNVAHTQLDEAASMAKENKPLELNYREIPKIDQDESSLEESGYQIGRFDSAISSDVPDEGKINEEDFAF